MNIIKAFDTAYIRAKEREWDYIVILVDIHDTIFKACWDKPETYEYLGKAKETLQMLSKRDDVQMILWSSSYDDKLLDYMRYLWKDGIIFNAVNANIVETKNTKLACFDEKPYFSVGIDNAFGFEPETDWETIYEYFKNK